MRLIAGAFALLMMLAVAPAGAVMAAEPTAKDVAAEAGIQDTVRTFSARAGDFTGDGLDDLIVVNHLPQENTDPYPSVYRNNGGNFTRLSQLQTHQDRHVCAFGDFNLNGLTDIVCANGDVDPEELWAQQSRGNFIDRAAERGLVDSQTSHRTVTFIDANGDPYPDIYLTRYEKPDRPPGTNTLFLNQGPDASYSFAPAPEWGLNVRDGAFKDADACTLAEDFDGDGDEDLTYCSPYGFRLYENTGSGFMNTAITRHVGGEFVDADWADFNQDGMLDLVQVNGGHVRVRLQQASGDFSSSFVKDLIRGTNLATGDFNADGLTDVFVTQGCKRDINWIDYPDYILLGEGTGTAFTVKEKPALPRGGGCGHVAERINYDNDPNHEFVVLNGHKRRAGPVQLFDWR